MGAEELALTVDIRADRPIAPVGSSGRPKGAWSALRPGVAITKVAILVCLALAAVALVGCAGADEPTCTEGSELFVRYELFMGRSNQSGEVVDDSAWAAFLEDTVTPRFPDGLTVLDGQGQWRGSDGIVQKERSKLLVILSPPGGDGARLINEVSEEYKRRFDQESVLRVVSDACVSF